VAKKRRVGRYPKEFRRMAVERLRACDNIVELSQELGVHRRLLYKWRDQFDPFDPGEESPPGNSRESTLRKENNQLKRALVDKTLELDLFKGAYPKLTGLAQGHTWRETNFATSFDRDFHRKSLVRNVHKTGAFLSQKAPGPVPAL
jgi:transposase-like protein